MGERGGGGLLRYRKGREERGKEIGRKEGRKEEGGGGGKRKERMKEESKERDSRDSAMPNNTTKSKGGDRVE
jgi:hypothetical protein